MVARVPEISVLAPRLTISARRAGTIATMPPDHDAEAAEVGKAAQRIGEDQARALRQRAGRDLPELQVGDRAR
jgi:hypothetical protein